MGVCSRCFAGIFPLMGLLFVWVARPKLVDAAFDTWIWPLLGASYTQRRDLPGYLSTTLQAR